MQITSKITNIFVGGESQAHELAVDTPQVAGSFVPSLPVSGPAESRVERVSHRLWPAAEGSNPGRGPRSWD